MSDKLLRLLNIIHEIQVNPGITAADLAFKYERNIRTIQRDIDLLASFAPIVNEGRGTGYRFIGRFHLEPLDFTEQEAVAFTLLPSVLDADKKPPGFDSAYIKVMSTHLKEQSSASRLVGDIADIIQMGTPAYRKQSTGFLQPIIEAILQRKTVRTVYYTMYRDETTTRQIDPYYLIPREQRFYLIGYCHDRKAVRTFRISRFLKVELTDHTFDKGKFKIRRHLKNTWSIQQGDRNVTFKVRFSATVARYVQEEELFVHPRMKKLRDGSLLFEVTVNNEQEFIRWILQYGPDAEILEPQSARASLRERLDKWERMYR